MRSTGPEGEITELLLALAGETLARRVGGPTDLGGALVSARRSCGLEPGDVTAVYLDFYWLIQDVRG
ncbi:hypothetical protein scyTo_0022343 [Scyliorhinus torazame]|uniref:Uncharacterized protein n=1 Tax=Scyliorhinus torazame TaxID=75743 RepID=A0A401QAV0_SCYTO|nr:hypothetical protein [Scyliorhinus torazame]